MSPSLAEATGVELITASYDLAETARATVEPSSVITSDSAPEASVVRL